MESLSARIAAGFPPPRRDEPASLRRDIADELADHFACALAQELDRTPDEAAARAAVLERLGDPARLARRLWLDAMKEAIMKDRVLMAGIVLVALATLAVAALGWTMLRESRETNRALLAAIDKMAAAPKEPAAAVSPDLATLRVRVLRDTPGKEPLADARVSINGKMFAEESTRLERTTDANGLVEVGPIRPGAYTVTVNLDRLSSSRPVTPFAGKVVEETILAPVVRDYPVHPRLDLPADLGSLDIAMAAKVSTRIRATDGAQWRSSIDWRSDTEGLVVSAPASAAPASPAEGKPSPAEYRIDNLSITLPPSLLQFGSRSDPAKRGRISIAFGDDTAAQPTLGPAAFAAAAAGGTGGADWPIRLPQGDVARLRLLAAGGKFLPGQAPVDLSLLAALPHGPVQRLVPLDKATNVWSKEPQRQDWSNRSNLLPIINCPGDMTLRHNNSSGFPVSGGPSRGLLDWHGIAPADVAAVPGRRCFLALYATRSHQAKDASTALREVEIAGVIGDWSEASATWVNQPALTTQTVAATPTDAMTGWKTFDVTELLRAGTRPGASLHGLAMRFREELADTDTGANGMGWLFGGRLADPEDRSFSSDLPRDVSIYWSIRPLLVVVDPEEPGRDAEPTSVAATAPEPAADNGALAPEPTVAPPSAPSPADAVKTREERIEQRKAELRALVEQRRAENAAQSRSAAPQPK